MFKYYFLLISFLFLGVKEVDAQAMPFSELDMDEFIEDVQLNFGEADSFKLYWWLPIEFWKISFAQQGMTDEQMGSFLEVLEPLTMVAVIEAEIGLFASMTYADPDSLRKDFRILDSEQKEYAPLEEEKLSFDVQMMLNMLKPMMANMLGEMGENVQFFVFDNADKKGNRIFSPYEPNSITAKYKTSLFPWTTPVPSLLEKKRCPTDGELYQGDWKYCPYCGAELEKK